MWRPIAPNELLMPLGKIVIANAILRMPLLTVHIGSSSRVIKFSPDSLSPTTVDKMPTLPIELLRIIVDIFLAEDNPARARAASLVWKDWQGPAQARIFKRVCLRGEVNPTDFIDGSQWLSDHPRLAGYILHLELRGISNWRINGIAKGVAGELRLPLVAACLRALPGLETLHIAECKWLGGIYPSTLEQHPIKIVIIEDVECREWEGNVLDVLSLASELQEVRLTDIVWQHHLPRAATSSMRPLQAELFSIKQQSSFPNARAWPACIPRVYALRRLHIEGYGWDQVDAFRQIVLDNRETLEMLYIVTEPWMDSEQNRRAVIPPAE